MRAYLHQSALPMQKRAKTMSLERFEANMVELRVREIHIIDISEFCAYAWKASVKVR